MLSSFHFFMFSVYVYAFTSFCLQYMYDFLEAAITRQTSKEEAYKKLDDMANKQTETLRKLTKQVRCSSQLLSVFT